MNYSETKKHGPQVLKSLNDLSNNRMKMLEITKKMISAYKGTMYPLDLLAIGAIKRSLSTIYGFKLLIESWNMICARSLLRIQLDTAMRFYAAYLVENPHDFATRVLHGERIDKLRDRDKQLLKDAYLVSKLTDELPWLPEVYKNLSGYIHLSGSHIFDSLVDFNDSGIISWAMTDDDSKFPELSWCEIIVCFNEALDFFMRYLEGWTFTKDNPELVGKIKKALKLG